jgi:tetratricopeptide (TPR) repeat protein
VREAQRVLERVLGPDHVNLANCYANLAAILESRGRPAEAEPLHRRALAIRRRELGDTHPATGRSLQLLGVFLLRHQRWDEAEVLTREALALFRAIDPHHFEVGKALHGLGQIAAGRGRPAEAERYLTEATEEFRLSLGEKHPFVWMASSAVARQQEKQGRLDEAEERLREALARLRALVDDGNEYIADVEGPLADLLRRRGRLDEALALHRHAARTLTAIYGERHLKVVEARARVVADLAADPARWNAAAAEEARAVRALLAELDPQSVHLAELDRWLASPV